jgi:KipI family sensor histidine kinase inhibitor
LDFFKPRIEGEGSMEIYPAGDCALCVEFGQEISPALNKRVHALARSLREKPVAGVSDLVPAYSSLLVCFDPLAISSRRLGRELRRRIKKYRDADFNGGNMIRIPVCYEAAYAPDMETVSAHTGFAAAEIIERHTKPVYRIYMLGFLPGFPYLGGMDSALETPRLTTPRTKIPAGAVGIGGVQTGIYPLESPGGWQLIGRTPVRVYDPRRENPILYRAGDSIVFYPISAAEYENIARSQSWG